MPRSTRAPISSASCFFRRRRAISARRRARTRRARAGPRRKVALTVDADDALHDAIIDALQPDMLQLHGHETPERVAALQARFGLPVMKALPIETRGRPCRDRGLCPGRRLAAVRCARRRATRPGRAASAGRSTGRCWKRLIPALPVHAVRRARCRAMSPQALAHHAGARRRCVVRGRARAGRQGSLDKIRAFVRAARAADARTDESCEQRMTIQQPNSFRTGPDESGHFGIYRRPLRRRDADAADPRTGDRPTPTPRTIRPSRRRWTAISSIMSAGRRRSISPSA